MLDMMFRTKLPPRAPGYQFWGWSPASSGDGRPPVLGLVARQFLGLVARQFSGWSPASSRVGRPPVLGMVAQCVLLYCLARRECLSNKRSSGIRLCSPHLKPTNQHWLAHVFYRLVRRHGTTASQLQFGTKKCQRPSRSRRHLQSIYELILDIPLRRPQLRACSLHCLFNSSPQECRCAGPVLEHPTCTVSPLSFSFSISLFLIFLRSAVSHCQPFTKMP